MRKSVAVVLACVGSLLAADVGVAQPRPYHEAWPGKAGPQHAPPPGATPHAGPDHTRRPEAGAHQSYYYNGRWIGADEWGRRSGERDRWVDNYQSRRPRRDSDDSSALVAGIIGFALGAAIIGTLEEAERAQGADKDWDRYCSRKYRSYVPVAGPIWAMMA